MNDTKPLDYTKIIADLDGVAQDVPIPECCRGPGVYFLCSSDSVIYVGQAISPMKRIGEHLSNSSKIFDRVFVLSVPKSMLDDVEGAFIRTLRPALNGVAPNGTPGISDKLVLSHVYNKNRIGPINLFAPPRDTITDVFNAR